MKYTIFCRRFLFASLVATLLVACFSCKKKKGEVYPQHDRPTWTVTDTANLEYSMTVIGSLPESLCASVDTTNDLVAAFYKDKCCGVTSLQRPADMNDKPIFFLYIVKPSDTPQQFEVTLRYYSAATRYIFVAKNAFVYSPEGSQGDIDKPFVPDFSEQE